MSNSASVPLRSGAVAKRPAATATPAAADRKRDGAPKLRLAGVSQAARRQAAAILEVLAGVRTPLAAAQLLGMSLPRYYAGELRALQALLAACEPRPRGRVRSPTSELAALRRECEQLRRDCGRQQALVRAAQRTIGLTAPAPAKPAKPAPGSKRRRPRKPTARALKAARLLQEETPSADPAGSAQAAHP
jgi:hypothetical protein